jgi:ABC-type sulfate/molybdate transport systems ATPase subunit
VDPTAGGPALESALGNVAQGARFWDRETEVQDMRSYLSSGTSLLLVGPRRIGKTSVLRRVLESVDTPHVFVDAQAANVPARERRQP